MTTTTATPHITLKAVAQHVAQRKSFQCNRTLRGTYFDVQMGQLPIDRRAGFLRATDADDFYAVYSYSTPIAWYSHGTWTVPDVRYSVTTTRHQNAARKGIAK